MENVNAGCGLGVWYVTCWYILDLMVDFTEVSDIIRSRSVLTSCRILSVVSWRDSALFVRPPMVFLAPLISDALHTHIHNVLT